MEKDGELTALSLPPQPMSAMDERLDQVICGRGEQLALFQRYLSGESAEGRTIWNIYGTGGIGKSFLIDSFRRQAQRAGAIMVYMDSRDFIHQGELFCRELLLLLRLPASAGDPALHPNALTACLNRLKLLSSQTKVVLALDTYEEMGELDGWLRDRLIPWLPDRIMLLIAGRYKLKGAWALSPALRERLLFMPLGHLTKDESAVYLRQCGMTDVRQIEHAWFKTGGHPLALALAADVSSHSDWVNGADESEWFDHLAAAWLREVPDPRLRKMVEAASVLLRMNHEVLQTILDEELDGDTFNRLISLSFVRKTERGWMLHDLMRLAMRKQLEERMPARFEKLRSRAAQYYAARIRDAAPYRNTAWEVGELFYYSGTPLQRALILSYARGRYVWEPLTLSNLSEGEAYLRRRLEQATPLTLSGMDPETEQAFDEFVGKEEMTYTIKHLDLRAWAELDGRAAMLLRSTDGRTMGVAVIVPIHKETLPALRKDPFASPYLSSLKTKELVELEAEPTDPAGWFIRTIDYGDWQNPDMITETMYLMFSYMCSGGIFITSPPPMDFFRDAHLSLGFRQAPGVMHHHYDGRTPTPTFVLDTRGEKLEQFLRFLLQKGGFPEERRMPREYEMRLSSREREVAALVLEGMTNAEISRALYVSEITVKKHVSSVYGKLDVKGRSQLIKLLAGHRPS
ncbi:HTH-type transcriptional regulator MalT [Paenibacillus solanacearum]|uniref:HTH-type transcriptional regulator MalT n=1 Tax=Paenibacillus solanacearum TaxID=2048548 RepID=A0A916NIN2_9BACL|nr:LuxR family transcriptional regulator [Paenibacillus solanacearum]CAG7623270.1 HTH-type transcriptional regulator MalT [Paenibacillus solanacearum]